MEYKILTKTPEVLQKLLNQWKHDYNLHIISTTPVTLTTHLYLICVLTRTPKTKTDTHLSPIDDNFCDDCNGSY